MIKVISPSQRIDTGRTKSVIIALKDRTLYKLWELVFPRFQINLQDLPGIFNKSQKS